MIHQRHRQRDGQTNGPTYDMRWQDCAMHYSASRVKRDGALRFQGDFQTSWQVNSKVGPALVKGLGYTVIRCTAGLGLYISLVMVRDEFTLSSNLHYSGESRLRKNYVREMHPPHRHIGLHFCSWKIPPLNSLLDLLTDNISVSIISCYN